MRITIDKAGRIVIHKQGILVHHGTDSVDIDTADFVNKARKRRNSDLVAEKPRK